MILNWVVLKVLYVNNIMWLWTKQLGLGQVLMDGCSVATYEKVWRCYIPRTGKDEEVRKYKVHSRIRGSTCLARAEEFYEEMTEGLLQYWLELISMQCISQVEENLSR